MKKQLFRIVLILYLIAGSFGLIRSLRYAYTQAEMLNIVFSKALLLLVAATICIVPVIIYGFKYFFPGTVAKIREKKTGVILVPLAALLVLLINTGIVLWEDLTHKPVAHFRITGVVMNKKKEARSGRSGPDFYLSVSDTITSRNYYFSVQRKIFERYSQDDVFVKEFYISPLGVIYRKEE